MKIYVQVVQGDKYELEVNQHTSIEEARDFLIKNYYNDFKYNLPTSSSNGSITITYKFIYNGKYLFDPDPFSALKEYTRVILYIKKTRSRGLVRLEMFDDSENEAEEEDSSRNEMNLLRQIVTRASNVALIPQAFNPRNSFWNHTAELSQVENILQGEASQGAHFISSSFMVEHFRQLFRYNDINIGTILNVLGGGPFITFGNNQIKTIENNNNNDDNSNDTNNSSIERNIYNNQLYYDFNNNCNNNFESELDIIIMEMPTTAKNAYDNFLKAIESIPDLNTYSKQIGALKVAQIFKENAYDINKSIDSLNNSRQTSNNNNTKTSNIDN